MEGVAYGVIYMDKASSGLKRIKESHCTSKKSTNGKHEWKKKVRLGSEYLQCEYCEKTIYFKE